MAEKDIPIKKKQVKDILKGLTWAEKLKILDSLAETCRRKSRAEVYGTEKKKGVDDYPV